MRKLFVIIGLLSFSLLSKAQEFGLNPYTFSGGVRGGFLTAVTAKYFFKNRLAVEAIGGIRNWQGPHGSVLLEYHHPNVFHVENLYIYYGGGISTGYFRKYINDHLGNKILYASPYIGLEGIFGFEYNFTDLINFPVSATVDVKPGFDLYPFSPSFYSGAVSIRYIFK